MAKSSQNARSVQLMPGERQRRIAELVSEQGFVRGRALAEMFSVTEETIRRDLMQLDNAGLVHKSHGGAVARIRNETTFDRRLHEHEAAKVAIARAAADMVAEGSTIIMDSGSTTIHMARALQDKRDLVVVTNAVTHAVELMKNDSITVTLTGGVLRRLTSGAAGDLAVSTLNQLSVDQTFLAINSVSLERGLMYPDFEEVAVKRAMIGAASEVILLADHTKFDRRSLVRVAPLSVLTCVVTDSGIDAKSAAAIREQGIELVIAPVAGESESSGGSAATTEEVGE